MISSVSVKPRTISQRPQAQPVRFSGKLEDPEKAAACCGCGILGTFGAIIAAKLAVLATAVGVGIYGYNTYTDNQAKTAQAFQAAPNQAQFLVSALNNPEAAFGAGSKAIDLISDLPDDKEKARVIVQVIDSDVPWVMNEQGDYLREAATIDDFKLRSKVQQLINNRPGGYNADAEIFKETKAELARELGLNR